MSTSSYLRNRYWVLRHGKSIPNEKGIIISSMENGTLAEFGLASEGVSQAQLAGASFLKELKDKNTPLENVRICYSPFSRTMHTAKMVTSVLNLPFEGGQCMTNMLKLVRMFGKCLLTQDKNLHDVCSLEESFKRKTNAVVMEELRERYFGPTFELQSHDKYPEIWALDEKDPFMPPEGGESAADVASRLAMALATIEAEFEGFTVLVVSHGDPLQILQSMLHAVCRSSESNTEGVLSRIKGTITKSTLSQHRKFALNTGELQEIV